MGSAWFRGLGKATAIRSFRHCEPAACILGLTGATVPLSPVCGFPFRSGGLSSLRLSVGMSLIFPMSASVGSQMSWASPLLAVASHKFDSQHFKSRVSRPISKCMDFCVEP